MTRKLLLLPVFLLLAAAATGGTASTSPDPTSLVVPSEELSKARDLVQRLGSEEFHDREQAERDLERMGRAAREALLEGASNDPSPEVRSRCGALLPRATALELKARLEVFLADVEGKYDHDLAGWNQFRKILQDEWSLFGFTLWSDGSLDRTGRKVFAGLLTTSVNRQIVLATSGPETELAEIVANRRQELYNQKYGRVIVGGRVMARPGVRQEPSVEDIATLLFGEVYAPAQVMPRNVSVSVLLNSSGFLNAARAGDEKGKVYQAIAGAWLDSRKDPMDMYNALSVASNLGLPEKSCNLAVRLLHAKGGQPFYRGQAAATLARLGNKSHIPLLEKLFDDASVLTLRPRQVIKDGKPMTVNTEIQVRDVALAVAITLSSQNPTDFGFDDQYKNMNNPNIAFSYVRYSVEDDQRKATFEKWKAWREKHSLKRND
ncbi:MAG TPA: hypothetical protein VLM40_07215 [Gemmata sp.]|nr:hypothetical protein [Gemmata sp.]